MWHFNFEIKAHTLFFNKNGKLTNHAAGEKAVAICSLSQWFSALGTFTKILMPGSTPLPETLMSLVRASEFSRLPKVIQVCG